MFERSVQCLFSRNIELLDRIPEVLYSDVKMFVSYIYTKKIIDYLGTEIKLDEVLDGSQGYLLCK